jgi:mannose-6-phosphate isomerase-like protein (cupin superfamily)
LAEWSLARLDEIPTDRTPEWWSEWSRTQNYGGGWHSIRKHFGIEAFGVNAIDAGPGEELIVPHDELDYGNQEELYYLVSGRARFVVGGEEVELTAGDLLHVPADVRREATALDEGTRLFMVGGTPGRPYERWDEKW